jgi:hypothetical protein
LTWGDSLQGGGELQKCESWAVSLGLGFGYELILCNGLMGRRNGSTIEIWERAQRLGVCTVFIILICLQIN